MSKRATLLAQNAKQEPRSFMAQGVNDSAQLPLPLPLPLQHGLMSSCEREWDEERERARERQ